MNKKHPLTLTLRSRIDLERIFITLVFWHSFHSSCPFAMKFAILALIVFLENSVITNAYLFPEEGTVTPPNTAAHFKVPNKSFLKPFLKGKILRSSERGVNSILTTILQFWLTSWKDRIFCLVASDSARRKDHFQKKICPKRTFPSNFVKLVSKILYLFLAEKMVVCCCLLLLLLLLLLFVATLSDFGLLFF